MPEFTIAFSPPPGVISDDTAFAASRWASASNVRFWRDKPQSIGGWAKLFANALSGVPRRIFALDRSGTVTLAYGTSTKLYVGVGAAQPTDRSPVGLGSGITAWSMGAWGSTLLASPKGGTLYQQSGTSTATEITQAPDVINCMLVTQQRQVLAFGCNEEVSGIFNGLCIRGCDLEDFTSWTSTATNNAFEHILDGVGQIVAAREIGSYVAVWTETSLFLGQFLGDPGQTFRFDKVDDNSGCIGPDAVTVTGGRAYWIATDLRVRTWAPGELPSLIDCPVSRSFRAVLSFTNRAKVLVCTNSQFDEIWIFYPSGASENVAYYAFSLHDGAWFQGSNLGRSATLDSGSVANILGSSYTTTLLAADSSGFVYVHETGTTREDGTAIGYSVTSDLQYMNEGEGRVMLKSVMPDLTFTGTVRVDITAYDTPSGEATGSKSLTISAAGKRDFRLSGHYFSIGIVSTTNPLGAFRLGKLVFTGVTMGRR